MFVVTFLTMGFITVEPAQAAIESVRCESMDKRYEDNCFARDEIVSIRVLRQISNKLCMKNINYGFDGDRVWVDGGCRAIFQVETLRRGGGRLQVTCYSKGGQPLRLNSRDATYGVATAIAPSGQSVWVVSGCERGRGCDTMLNCFPNHIANQTDTDFRGVSDCRRYAPTELRDNFSQGAGNYLSYCEVR